MDGEDRLRQDYIEFDAFRAVKTGEMISSKLRALHDYWDALRAGRLTPMRSDIDARNMPPGLRHFFILEALGSGAIRFRVTGSGIAEAFGMELRGMNVRSIMAPGSRESFVALLSEALEDPGVGYARLSVARQPKAIWEINFLPLRSDFGRVDRLLGGLVPLGTTVGRTQGPLQFQIDHMQVETIVPTIVERDLPARMTGFAERAQPFDHQGPPTPGPRPRLRSIDGGRDGGGTAAPRRNSHLRVVED